MFRKLWMDEGGALLCSELVLVCTILFCACGAGLVSFSAKLVDELSDLGSSIGALDQSFFTTAIAIAHEDHDGDGNNDAAAFWEGSSLTDDQDACDVGCDCGVIRCIPAAGKEVHDQCA